METRAPAQLIPIDEYLQDELVSEVRHEYLGGRIHAMVGAGDRHNLISVNLATALRLHVRGTACQLFMADMKARGPMPVRYAIGSLHHRQKTVQSYRRRA